MGRTGRGLAAFLVDIIRALKGDVRPLAIDLGIMATVFVALTVVMLIPTWIEDWQWNKAYHDIKTKRDGAA